MQFDRKAKAGFPPIVGDGVILPSRVLKALFSD
jgi:hypothetical protein